MTKERTTRRARRDAFDAAHRSAHRQGRDASGCLPPAPGTKTGAQDER